MHRTQSALLHSRMIQMHDIVEKVMYACNYYPARCACTRECDDAIPVRKPLSATIESMAGEVSVRRPVYRMS